MSWVRGLSERWRGSQTPDTRETKPLEAQERSVRSVLRGVHRATAELLTAAVFFTIVRWVPLFPPPLAGWLVGPSMLRVFQTVLLTAYAAVPAALIALLLHAVCRRSGWARTLTAAAIALYWGMLTFDTQLFNNLGVHLAEVLTMAPNAEGTRAGAAIMPWVAPFVRNLLIAVLFLAAAFGVSWVARRIPLSAGLRWIPVSIHVGAWVCLLAAATALIVRPATWLDVRAALQFFSAAPWDLGGVHLRFERADQLPPRWARLQNVLEKEYRRSFGFLSGPAPQREVHVTGDPGPDVILIVLESWRPDMLTPAIMPRLTRVADQGWVSRTTHHAGTNRSELGLYSLIYADSPLKYERTLDAKRRPVFAYSLAAAGYHTLFATGHPRNWYRREEFVNDEFWDEYIRTDQGTWSEWDRRAFRELKRRMDDASRQPIAAVLLLMTSHYDYRAPKSHERFRPTSLSAVSDELPSRPLERNGVHFADQPMSILGPAARDILWNRYRNSMLYLDDLVGEFVESLDPRRAVVVITGDHGEAFGEGDHFGHISIYGKTPTHTPLVIWGRGVPPGKSVQRPTCHTDVMPTVFALLGATRRQLQTLPGRDLLSTDPRDAERHSQHFIFSVSRSTYASNLLFVSKRRRLLTLMDRKQPRIVPVQFEGPEGEILTEEPTDSDIDDFRRLFRELY